MPRSSTCARCSRSTPTRSRRQSARPVGASSSTRQRARAGSAPSCRRRCRNAASTPWRRRSNGSPVGTRPYPHAQEWDYFPGPARVGAAYKRVDGGVDVGTYVVKLPDVGEGIAEAELVEWHVAVGDVITEDQPIADVMTDKATVELPSPVGGDDRQARRGSRRRRGDRVRPRVDRHRRRAGRRPVADEQRPPKVPPSRSQPPEIDSGDGVGDDNRNPRPGAASTTRAALAAPAVRRRADDLGIDLASLAGSGPDGRVVHGDLDRLLAERRIPATSSAAAPTPAADDVEAVKVIGLRRNIAQRMQESTRRIPALHVRRGGRRHRRRTARAPSSIASTRAPDHASRCFPCWCAPS